MIHLLLSGITCQLGWGLLLSQVSTSTSTAFNWEIVCLERMHKLGLDKSVLSMNQARMLKCTSSCSWLDISSFYSGYHSLCNIDCTVCHMVQPKQNMARLELCYSALACSEQYRHGGELLTGGAAIAATEWNGKFCSKCCWRREWCREQSPTDFGVSIYKPSVSRQSVWVCAAEKRSATGWEYRAKSWHPWQVSAWSGVQGHRIRVDSVYLQWLEWIIYFSEQT